MDLYAELGSIRKVAEALALNKDKIQRMITVAKINGLTAGGDTHE